MTESGIRQALKLHMDTRHKGINYFGMWDNPRLNSNKKHQNARMVQKAKSEGYKTKLPDWWVMVPRGNFSALMIELKTKDAAAWKWMPRKKKWIWENNEHYKAQATELATLWSEGYFACFADGLEEAKSVIDWYLSGAEYWDMYFEEYAFSGGRYAPERKVFPRINQKTLTSICV